MKYVGSLLQNYISGNVWKMMSDAEKYFHFQVQTKLSHMQGEYEMNHARSFSYYHISGNVRKMMSGVVGNFLFQLVKTLSPLFSKRHFQMRFLEWKSMNFD